MPGSGDFPVGQFDAQNLFPKGSGMPSFASSADECVSVKLEYFKNGIVIGP